MNRPPDATLPPSRDAGPLRVRWINPIGIPDYDAPIAALLGQIKDPLTAAQVVSFRMDDSPHDLEYLTYEALVTADLVRVVRDTAREGWDAAVVGCFYDVGLDAAREISGSTVVVAPCQAACQTVVNLANRFSVIVGREKWVDQMRRNVLDYGYGGYLASFRAVGLSVEEFQKDPDRTARLMLEEGRKAIEQDHAEALVLGCTIEFGFYERMQDELGVPVIDCTLNAFKAAEHAARLKRSFAWSPSRQWGCEPPPEADLARWKIFAAPAPIGNRVDIPPAPPPPAAPAAAG
ncbi:MAG TPA: aspartate/glutamate racemase family protein [Longimicrobium sp.]|nr:aspartate/glutamate racemase family protein [Longimicrobium sp.]